MGTVDDRRCVRVDGDDCQRERSEMERKGWLTNGEVKKFDEGRTKSEHKVRDVAILDYWRTRNSAPFLVILAAIGFITMICLLFLLHVFDTRHSVETWK
jgi:hypothetical protein